MSSYSTEVQTLKDSLKVPDSPECPICGEDTNGLLFTHHIFNKYLYVPEVEKGLIKCIKCTYAVCCNCHDELLQTIKICPAKCGASLNNYESYREYGLDRSLEYAPQSNTVIWLAQDIYEDQKNGNIPRPLGANAEMIPYQVHIDTKQMTISARLNITKFKDPIELKIPIYLVKSTSITEANTSQYILNTLENHFRKQINSTFDIFNQPVNQINLWQELTEFKHLDQNETNLPDFNKSLFQLGYLEYIQKVFLTTLDIFQACYFQKDDSPQKDIGRNNQIFLLYQMQFGKPGKTIYQVSISDYSNEESDSDGEYENPEHEFLTPEETQAFMNDQI